ncbi:MAG: NAD(P)H-hydrate dehydratase [Candidatus Omnitrophica bacterium]|nr:NAD(P)H-hydrate dehydratase [Candidatus Omnitrophota bacterium]
MRLPVQLLKRNPETHKGDYGCVLIIGASLGLTGAVCLSARAALKIGAGLVRVGVPKSLNNIFEIKLTEEMSLPLADKGGSLTESAFSQIEKVLDKVDVLVIGPGASLANPTRKLILRIIRDVDKPIVIDADAISALASDLSVLDKRKTKQLIITPHYQEFSRLVKVDIEEIKKNRKELAGNFALRYNLTLVLKGNRSLVVRNKEFFENDSGNAGMATAGSGDVLSGIIAGLVAQGLKPFEAAKLGVYLHGLSGDLAVKDKTESCLIASDLIDYLPQAIKSSL